MEPKAQRSRTADAAAALRVSAIVVTYNTGDCLELCLRSLFSEPWVDEIILVDNGNPAPVSSSLRALQADRRDVTLVQGHGNVGFARGCNLGAELASGAHLLFINPDAVLQRGSAERMVEAGRRARRPWIVGGRLVDKRGREQRGARRELLTPWTALVGMLGLGGLEKIMPVFRDVHRERDPKPDTVVPIPVVSGALMMMPRADFAAIGGFDEGYFLHVEDIDICRRVGEAGGAVLFEPGAEALHFGGTSSPSAASVLKVEEHKARGLVYYFDKFARSPGEKAMVKVLAPGVRALLMVRGLFRAVLRRR
jgi:hypothetical protein